MRTANQKFNFLILTLLSVVLSALTLVLGALPLRLLFNHYRRALVWLVLGLLLAGFWFMGIQPVAVSLATMAVLTGVFTELDKARLSLFLSGIISVFLSSVTAFILVQAWMKQSGWAIADKIREQIDVLVQRAHQLNSTHIPLDGEALYAQVPSAVIGILIMALAMAVILDRRISYSQSSSLQSLRKFRLPDLMIWVAMGSFLLSFLDLGHKTLNYWSVNIFNVSMVMYFLQGVAILETMFSVFRVGPLMKWVTYILLTTQLFFAVSALGFIDFWMDFRSRFSKAKPVQ